MIFGERIRQLREILDLTQVELAQKIDVHQSLIAKFEAGLKEPSNNVLEALAFQTGFPKTFFSTEPAATLPLGSLLFRARASVSPRKRERVRSLGSHIHELGHLMTLRMQARALRLPRVAAAPAEAAQIARSELGLSPDAPVPHLIHALETAGVMVWSLPEPIERCDAFSTWVGIEHPQPALFISPDRPGDRLRFTVAHEAGHLVRPPNTAVDIETIEHEADAFASELLLPAAAMRRELLAPVTLTGLAPLKARWGVSLQALIQRALTLEIITGRQRRYLFEQLSSRGWRLREPIEIPQEKPRAFRKMAELLFGLPVDVRLMARELRSSHKLLERVLERHAGQVDAAQPVVSDELPRVLDFKKA